VWPPTSTANQPDDERMVGTGMRRGRPQDRVTTIPANALLALTPSRGDEVRSGAASLAAAPGGAGEPGMSGGNAAARLAAFEGAQAALLMVTPQATTLLPLVEGTASGIPDANLAFDLTGAIDAAGQRSGEEPVDGSRDALAAGIGVVATAVSAGIVGWTIYGGTALWILLATGPLARIFDPLPILAREGAASDTCDDDEGDDDEDEDEGEDEDEDDEPVRRPPTRPMAEPA
jgi:hypothetical protein